MVKIGTAALMPTIPVNAGSKIKAPPNPAAPDIVAAIKDMVNNIRINLVVYTYIEFVFKAIYSARS
ncbi:MAG: hypothetical protein QXT71_03640 [Thermoplasmata archaeon]